MKLDELRAKVEALPVHSISGYEWECDNCQYRYFDSDPPPIKGYEGTYDSAGNPCDHGSLLDRDLVLAALREWTAAA